MKTLKTDRLVLRPLKEEDLDAFHHYAKKPNIGPMAGWKPHQSVHESYRILQSMIKDADVWGITLKDDPTLIGTIGLHVRTLNNALANRREIGYVLDDIYWGQGLMREAVEAMIRHAFDDLDLDEIACGHALSNTQSKRVIEKCGFAKDQIETREDFQGIKQPIQMYILRKNGTSRRKT